MNKLEWFIIWNINMSLLRNKIKRNKQLLLFPPKYARSLSQAMEGKYMF